MKVLHVAETIKGGVATVINELLSYQEKDNDICELAVLIPEEQKEEIYYHGKTKIKSFKRTKRGGEALFKLVIEFKKELKENNYDVIHLHSTFAGVICRLFLLFNRHNAKIIYCPHAFSFMMKVSKVRKIIFASIEWCLQFSTDKIICVSEYEKKVAVDYKIKESKLVVIYNGVSNDNYLPLFRKNNGDALRFLFIGRFDYQKGYDILMSAIEKLNKEGFDASFVIVGDYVGENKRNIKLNNENITYKGWLNKSEINSLYESCDVLLMPSRWEGFAMVPIEAFKHGVPVITSDIPPFLEIVEDRKNGLIFENENVEGLYAKIKEIALFDLTKLSLNAREKYKLFFTGERMASEIKNLYIGPKRGGTLIR
ncbi:glycosyltransferase family 4 protein [Klebsiella michiganensis]|uniref:glycosyltransferase family 4 protein n=1 Tax=Klebsiella michiganensis TaxID=1134687 RepID=UPI0012B6D5B9|nr:glycosyltransferase family 4 protein [Klebsiella michiganensis]EKV4190126.1 glycosyltransferase family 4 protein [Klebsiella michiganensis]HDF2352958.1 glycosyltransferase family 4 protein [Klebsiella michiganensis]